MALLRSLFGSRKFLAMLSGLIVLLALKLFKINLDPATVGEIVALVASYIVGQGIADNGKEAAKINAVSANAVTSPASGAAVTAMARNMTPPQGTAP